MPTVTIWGIDPALRSTGVCRIDIDTHPVRIGEPWFFLLQPYASDKFVATAEVKSRLMHLIRESPSSSTQTIIGIEDTAATAQRGPGGHAGTAATIGTYWTLRSELAWHLDGAASIVGLAPATHRKWSRCKPKSKEGSHRVAEAWQTMVTDSSNGVSDDEADAGSIAALLATAVLLSIDAPVPIELAEVAELSVAQRFVSVVRGAPGPRNR